MIGVNSQQVIGQAGVGANLDYLSQTITAFVYAVESKHSGNSQLDMWYYIRDPYLD